MWHVSFYLFFVIPIIHEKFFDILIKKFKSFISGVNLLPKLIFLFVLVRFSKSNTSVLPIRNLLCFSKTYISKLHSFHIFRCKTSKLIYTTQRTPLWLARIEQQTLFANQHRRKIISSICTERGKSRGRIANSFWNIRDNRGLAIRKLS